MTQPLEVKCPHCQKPVIWSAASPYRPFCSDRCRLIDLGAWANESYSIPVQTRPDDFAGLAGEDDRLGHD